MYVILIPYIFCIIIMKFYLLKNCDTINGSISNHIVKNFFFFKMLQKIISLLIKQKYKKIVISELQKQNKRRSKKRNKIIDIKKVKNLLNEKQKKKLKDEKMT